jgi:hypothetical protein
MTSMQIICGNGGIKEEGRGDQVKRGERGEVFE